MTAEVHTREAYVSDSGAPGIRDRLPQTTSGEALSLSVWSFAVVAIVGRLVGVGLTGIVGLFLALLSQSFIGYVLLGSMKAGMRRASLLAVACFGVGSLVLSVIVLIGSSLGDVPRAILRFGLDSGGALSGLIAVAVLGRRRWKSAGVLQTPDRDFWGFVSLACLLLVAVDWRLIFLVVSAAFAFFATPRKESQLRLPRWRWLLGPGSFVAFVEVFRAVFMRRDVVLNARELALGSVDVELWTSMAWSVLRFGPFEDVQKFGTMPGYHILAPTWAGATAAIAHVDVVILVSLIQYLVFGGLFLVSAWHIIQRYMTHNGQVGILIAFLLATGSLSAIELKAPLSPESLTQYVAVSWLMVFGCVAIAALSVETGKVLHLCVGLMFGSIYLAKVTVIIAVLLLVMILIRLEKRGQSRKPGLLILSGVVTSSSLLHVFYLFPARSEAFQGRIELSANVLQRLLNFLTDTNFSTPLIVMSTVLSLVFVIFLVGVLTPRGRAKDVSMRFSASGIVCICLATAIQFGTVGNGESYIWAYGTMFSCVGILAASEPQIHEILGARKFILATVLGIGVGTVSGAGFWLARSSRDELFAALGTLSLVLILAACGLSVFRHVPLRRMHTRQQPSNNRHHVRGRIALLGMFVIGSMTGNYFGYSVRQPVSEIGPLADSADKRQALLDIFSRSQLTARSDNSFLDELICLRKFTAGDAVFAVSGVPGSSVVGVAQRAVYFDQQILPYFSENTVIKKELDRRVELVATVIGSGRSDAEDELRNDGVDYLLVAVDKSSSVDIAQRDRSGVCSSEELLVREL